MPANGMRILNCGRMGIWGRKGVGALSSLEMSLRKFTGSVTGKELGIQPLGDHLGSGRRMFSGRVPVLGLGRLPSRFGNATVETMLRPRFSIPGARGFRASQGSLRVLRASSQTPGSFASTPTRILYSTPSFPKLTIVPLPKLEPPYHTSFSHFLTSKTPCIVPLEAFRPIPSCLSTWVTPSGELNLPYFEKHDSDSGDLGWAEVEIMSPTTRKAERHDIPFQNFMEILADAPTKHGSAWPRMYLPQHPLPNALQEDCFPPTLIRLPGAKGDLYGTCLWLGHPSNCKTPIHRDPNDNIFLQVSGKKKFRILPREALEGGVGLMELCEEESEPERWAWGEVRGGEGEVMGWEAEVGKGEALFLPRGVWHAVRGVEEGGGVCMSVNWWFR